jgi:O-antigen ligase
LLGPDRAADAGAGVQLTGKYKSSRAPLPYRPLQVTSAGGFETKVKSRQASDSLFAITRLFLFFSIIFFTLFMRRIYFLRFYTSFSILISALFRLYLEFKDFLLPNNFLFF